MYALAINGSPRADGNTAILLNAVLAPLTGAGWETELFQLAGRPLRGCLGCFRCFELRNMKCVIENDALHRDGLFERMLSAEAIVLGSPTYFADITAETKALIDRAGFVALANGMAFAGKIGAAAVAVRRGGATHAFDTVNHFFHISRMLVPGSTYWNMGYGMHPGEVKDDEEGLANMNHLGRVIDWLGGCVRPHVDGYPKGEPL